MLPGNGSTNGHLPPADAGVIPPCDTDAEEALLGSVLIDCEAITRVAGFLRVEDFYRERHGTIYAAMLALHQRRESIDFVTLQSELTTQGRLESVGGLLTLGRLLEVVPTSLHAEQYGRLIERAAIQRRLISTGSKIAALGYQADANLDQTFERAEQMLVEVAARRSGTKSFESIGDVLRAYLDQLESMQAGETTTEYGVPTGFMDLDHLLGGLQQSDLIILAARPAMGKTSLALNIAASAALRFGAAVGMFSLEMSAQQLAARLLSTETGIDSTRLRGGRLNEHESRRLAHALGILSESRIYVDDSATLSILELRARALRLKADQGCDLLIVDYLQLLGGSRGGRDNRVQEISEISRALKALARELHIPVLALSQLSRAVEQRSPHIPMLSDLRESGSIEQDADVVMFIYREEVYVKDSENKGIAELYIAKHRNGPIGQVRLFFNERTTQFANIEPFRA